MSAPDKFILPGCGRIEVWCEGGAVHISQDVYEDGDHIVSFPVVLAETITDAIQQAVEQAAE